MVYSKVEGWKEKFASEVDSYFTRLSEYKNPADIDLFFFPVAKYEHYYVICFNVQKRRIDILDNSATGFPSDLLDKYEDGPELLVSNL